MLILKNLKENEQYKIERVELKNGESWYRPIFFDKFFFYFYTKYYIYQHFNKYYLSEFENMVDDKKLSREEALKYINEYRTQRANEAGCRVKKTELEELELVYSKKEEKIVI